MDIIKSCVLKTCDTTSWPREVSADGSRCGPIRALRRPLNVRVCGQSGASAPSPRGQPRKIKCWTCIHPRKSSPSTSAGVSLNTCASTPAPISQRSRGAFCRRGDLLLQRRSPGEPALLWDLSEQTDQSKASVWHKNREAWQRWQEGCPEWWGRARTRTTRGEATLWKVKLSPSEV